MNYSLKPSPLIAHVLPGAYFLLCLGIAWFARDPAKFALLQTLQAQTIAAFAAVAFFSAWIIGLFFDAIRNGVVESIIDKHNGDRRWWDVFGKGSREKVDQLDDYYFSYYVVDANIVIATAALLVLWIIYVVQAFPGWMVVSAIFVLLLIVAGVFVNDAKDMRVDLRRLARECLDDDAASGETVPHDGVFVRLACSGPLGASVHGVGVFAIKNIAKGTRLFPEESEPIWFDRNKFANEPPEIINLYDDFCIIKKDGQYGCPNNFNLMTVSWYLNDARDGREPNVRCDEDYEFFAARDILKGEELLVDYDTYSERPV